jgi:hypothetical protein
MQELNPDSANFNPDAFSTEGAELEPRQKRQSRTGYLSNGAIPTRAVARSIAGSSRVKPPALRRRGPNYHR